MWTTVELGDELGVDDGRIARIARRWGWERTGDRWLFTDEQADRLRAHVIAYGLCLLHGRRLERTGTLEPGSPGDNQRAKTRCPQGHLYDEANTYVFADGRRRCRRCRIEQSMRSQRARRSAETVDA